VGNQIWTYFLKAFFSYFGRVAARFTQRKISEKSSHRGNASRSRASHLKSGILILALALGASDAFAAECYSTWADCNTANGGLFGCDQYEDCPNPCDYGSAGDGWTTLCAVPSPTPTPSPCGGEVCAEYNAITFGVGALWYLAGFLTVAFVLTFLRI